MKMENRRICPSCGNEVSAALKLRFHRQTTSTNPREQPSRRYQFERRFYPKTLSPRYL
jgi:hypothetical protein